MVNSSTHRHLCRPAHQADAGLTESSPPCQQLLQRLQALRLPYGREDSFKITAGEISSRRVLIGIPATHLAASAFFDLAHELGMPPDCKERLLPHMARANAYFLGIEDRDGGCVCKVYLEFWDQVRREVARTAARTPLMLHMGVKWDSQRPDRHETAIYTCHPLLELREILQRMVAVYPHSHPPKGLQAALDIVNSGHRNKPGASFLYLEASENDNPRCSFDINLYKTGLSVAQAAPQLISAAVQFGVPAEALRLQLQGLGHRAFGHLSGGVDRHGQEFLTVYGEIQPLSA